MIIKITNYCITTQFCDLNLKVFEYITISYKIYKYNIKMVQYFYVSIVLLHFIVDKIYVTIIL